MAHLATLWCAEHVKVGRRTDCTLTARGDDASDIAYNVSGAIRRQCLLRSADYEVAAIVAADRESVSIEVHAGGRRVANFTMWAQ